jgi:YidC/Oxa1 family membrane protein insertase
VAKQQLSWIILILAGVMLAGLWYVNRKAAQDELQRDRRSAGRQPATASAPATGPAGTEPPSQPPARAPVAEAAKAPRTRQAGDKTRSEWLWEDYPEDKITVGSLDPAEGYVFQVELLNRGAAIYTVKLADYFAALADKRLFESLDRNHAGYLAARATDPNEYRGHYSLLNPVREYLPYATRAIVVEVVGEENDKDESGHLIPISLRKVGWKSHPAKTATRPAGAVEVRFETTLHRDENWNRPDAPAAPRPYVRLTKTYRVVKDDYSLQMRLKVQNLSGKPLRVYVDQLGPTGVPLEELYRPQDDRFAPYGRLMAKDKNVQVPQKAQGEIQKGEEVTDAAGRRVWQWELPSGDPVALGRSDEAEPVLWVGQANKFFASMMYLRPAIKGRLAAADWQADYHFFAREETGTATSRAFVTGVRIGGKRPEPDIFQHTPDLVLPPGGQAKEMVFDIFAGPKIRDMFKDSSHRRFRKLYEDLNYFGTINFRSCFCASNWLTEKMMQLLKLIATKLTFHNYGLAIMVLVVLVRVILHPLTKKGQVNMVKMQKLQPEMAKLRKKYADDKETLQKEMMKFYKGQGATPLLGCLPMFLQMPIWISLWGSLNAAVELRHAAFLPVWITDLAGPDAMFPWKTPIVLPFIGGMVGAIRSFNLLPILLTVAMFLQMKFGPQMSQPTATATPEQEKQQQTQKRMMQIMMPAMMLLFFYNAASGLTLYIMTSTFAGVFEQFIIRKHIKAREAAEAAVVTTVKVPGKAARGSRPKKPKGPFFIKRG